MRLPEKFVLQMKELLKNEWPALLEAWDKPLYKGLRVNTLKIKTDEFLPKVPFSLQAVPWTADGFYLAGEDRPAKHPYYQAGLYYLQEPSAMAPAACLGVRPGDKVLDLCAAPGGKSTQIASALAGLGLLVSNDNSPVRVKALVWNLEHWGVRNAIVTNEEPARLSYHFPDFFDKVLVDAPCSGEGMFRKDAKAAKKWDQYCCTACAGTQKEILTTAAAMVKPGGRIVYSTCTFSPEENEGVVAHFLAAHPEFSLVELPSGYGWAEGRPDWLLGEPVAELRKTRRLWPHKMKGEGHFIALFEKGHAIPASPCHGQESAPSSELRPWYEFVEENLVKAPKGLFLRKGDYVYCCPPSQPSLKGLRVARYGWFLGMIRNKRFEPSQALAMGLRKSDVQRSISLSLDTSDVGRYLRRETLMVEGPKGWTLVCLEEFPLGWGKQTGSFLKNYYPPGWRLKE